MAQPTNLESTYDLVGIREQLSDTIFRVAHEKTPFFSALTMQSLESTFPEWQTETLSAPDTANAVIEGDDVAGDALQPTVRVGNRTQLSDKVVIVSSTARAVNIAGKADEFVHQTVRKGIELKKDIEAMMLNNQASVAGDDSTARRSAGLPAWLTSNVSRGVGGANGGYSTGVVAAATDGTDRALSRAYLDEVIVLAYVAGAMPDTVQVSPRVKQKISQYMLTTGTKVVIPSHEVTSAPARAISSVGVYDSDFGDFKLVPNIHQRDDDVFVLDFDYLAKGILQTFKTEPLAKTGHSEKHMLSVEWSLIVKNQAALGIVADIDETAAMVA